MQSLYALSCAPDVNDWLANSRQARILHVFEAVCNLINERGEILSLVTPQIGNGPFNLVIKEILFSEHLQAQSPISIHAGQLFLGCLTVNTAGAELWFPRPNWGALHAKRDEIFTQLLSFPYPTSHFSVSLSVSLASANLPASIAETQQLAGLGIGLTPAGDDFIMGAILAAWIIHPPKIAESLAGEIAKTAVPLTTSLSAAWLRSAGRGMAGILWHKFFDALIYADSGDIQTTLDAILSIGETSGLDALSGFVSVFRYWSDMKNTHPDFLHHKASN